MLATVAALASTLLAQQPVDKPTLELYQQRLVLRTDREVIRVPLREPVNLPAAVMFRRDDHYAVWDERGLTARSGAWAFSSQLKEFASSPRFFRRDEILQTSALVKKGERTLEASAISGAKRLGSRSYFLVRWDDAAGNTWQEALVAIDMADTRPKPRIIGRFEGSSMAKNIIDDKLFLREEGLEVVVQSSDSWGLARFDPKSEAFSFKPLGYRLQSYMSLSSSKGLFVETTAFGTTLAGEIDLKNGSRHILFQGRGPARFIDAQSPIILVANSHGGRVLVNASTGAETKVGSADDAKRGGRFIFTWSPSGTPKTARAFDPARWTEVASWKG